MNPAAGAGYAANAESGQIKAMQGRPLGPPFLSTNLFQGYTCGKWPFHFFSDDVARFTTVPIVRVVAHEAARTQRKVGAGVTHSSRNAFWV